MEQVRKAIGVVPRLAICIDAGKGLIAVVKQVFPWSEQRECFRHLMENMKKNFHGAVFAKNMWPAARAHEPGKHQYFLDKVFAASPHVKKWLDDHHNLLWARSKFSPNIKCDYINNNLAGSWNAWIKDFKDLPLHYMVDAIREKGVIMFDKRRRISRALHGVILPVVIHQLNASTKGLGHLRVTKGRPDRAEVTESYKDEEVRRHVVHLVENSYSCRQWQVTGKPCPHALVVLTTERYPVWDSYVDMAYLVHMNLAGLT
jgi:transposase-like protein